MNLLFFLLLAACPCGGLPVRPGPWPIPRRCFTRGPQNVAQGGPVQRTNCSGSLCPAAPFLKAPQGPLWPCGGRQIDQYLLRTQSRNRKHTPPRKHFRRVRGNRALLPDYSYIHDTRKRCLPSYLYNGREVQVCRNFHRRPRYLLWPKAVGHLLQKDEAVSQGSESSYPTYNSYILL